MNHGLDNDAQVFFYEHDFYPLSNFSAFAIHWKSRRFDTSEAVYHWEKFDMDGLSVSEQTKAECERVREQILYAPSAHEAYQIAAKNKALYRSDWQEIKVFMMREILWAKVTQHEYVMRKLLATGDRELVEDSWRDDFWGWGPEKNGQNVLGKLWMEIRKEIQADHPKPKTRFQEISDFYRNAPPLEPVHIVGTGSGLPDLRRR